VGSCALHETNARSLLRHRAHWWHQGPQFTTACCVSYVYILLVAISANVTLSHLSSRYWCLGSRLWTRRNENERSWMIMKMRHDKRCVKTSPHKSFYA
jgi:hypothetical protein